MCEGTRGPRRKFKLEHTLFCCELRFFAIYALYKVSFLSPNIRYFVGIVRFIAIYALYKASFRPDSDKRQHYFVQTKDNSFRPYSDKRQLPFVHTQTKDNFLSSRLRQKTASLRPDSDKRQPPFVQTQTKNSSLSFRLQQNTTFFRLEPDKELLLFVQSKKTYSLSPDSDKTYVAKDSTFRPDLNKRAVIYGTPLLVENWLYHGTLFLSKISVCFLASTAMQCNAALLLRRHFRPTKYTA